MAAKGERVYHAMADERELRMNLVAIKRVDPYAKVIVNSSAHVAFYMFNTTENEWEKTDVEGALFIYRRFAEPFHSIFINNRLNMNSLVEPITGQIELQTQPPFLLYRNERTRIRGFWFYNKFECDRIGDIIQSLVAECNETKAGSVPASASEMQSNGTLSVLNVGDKNVDLFSMLTKAQEDFENFKDSNVNSEYSPQQQQQQQQQKQQAAVAVTATTVAKPQSTAINIVQAQTTTTTTTQISSQNAPESVVNFFAAAKQPAASEVPLFQTLPVHTVEQIEKQHRASTPQKDALGVGIPTGKLTPEVSELETSFKMMGIPIMNAVPAGGGSSGGGGGGGDSSQGNSVGELGTSPLATFITAANFLAAVRSNNQPVLNAKPIEISELESRQSQQQQQQSQPLHELLKKSDQLKMVMKSPVTGTTKPALMLPTMFKTTSSPAAVVNQDLNSLFLNAANNNNNNSSSNSSNNNSSNNNNNTSSSNTSNTNNTSCTNSSNNHSSKHTKAAALQQQQQQQQKQQDSNGITVAEALSKVNNNVNHHPAAGGFYPGAEPLTQSQLIQAIGYLIKNDPDFVRKLHEAYMMSFEETVTL